MLSSRLLLSSGLLALSLAARAQTLCTADLSFNVGGSGTTTGTTSAIRSNQVDDNRATRFATTDVSLGVIKSYANAISINQSTSTGQFAFANGTWQDTMTIDAPGRTGQTGRLRVTFKVDGTLTATNSAMSGVGSSARAQAIVSVDGASTTFYDRRHAINGFSSNVEGGFLGRRMTPTYDFIYGQAFTLKFRLEAQAIEAHEGGVVESSATVDLAHTALWGGFDSVMDANGNEVANYTLASASGTNWAQPVPEPATLAVLGIGGLALLRRRKR